MEQSFSIPSPVGATCYTTDLGDMHVMYVSTQLPIILFVLQSLAEELIMYSPARYQKEIKCRSIYFFSSVKLVLNNNMSISRNVELYLYKVCVNSITQRRPKVCPELHTSVLNSDMQKAIHFS